jgi:predicted nuclease of predicted toxin-antitoxin system
MWQVQDPNLGLISPHVTEDSGTDTAADEAILPYAAANELVIVSADTDFGELLTASRGQCARW